MRAQLDHMLIDVDFFSNPKICALHRRFADAGILALLQIYGAMSRATNATIDEDALMYIVDTARGVEDCKNFIPYCLERGLIVQEGSGYSNSRVIADQERLYVQQEKWRDRKRKQRGIPLDVPLDNKGDSYGKSEEVKIEDLKTEDLRKKSAPQLTLPGAFNTPDIQKLVDSWQSRLGLHRRTLDQIGLEALIIRFQNPEKFKAALVYTLSLSKSLNVIDPPDKTPRFQNGKPEVKPRPNLTTYTPDLSDYVPPTPEISKRNKELLADLNKKVKGVA